MRGLATVLAVLCAALRFSHPALAADSGLVMKADGVDHFTYPFDRHLHRVVSITNTNGFPVTATLQIKATYAGGWEARLSTAFPKGPFLSLAPGETQQLVVSALWSEMHTAGWEVGGTYTQRVRIDVYVGPSGGSERYVFDTKVRVLAPFACEPGCRSPRPTGTPNATIAGRVTDTRGRGLAGVAVGISSPSSAADPAQVVTRSDGSFRSRVWTGRSGVSGTWTPFSVRAVPPAARRLQSRGAVVRVPADRTTTVKLVLPPRDERASYSLAASTPLEAQAWSAAASAAGDMFLVAPRNVDGPGAVVRALDRAGHVAWANAPADGVAGAFALAPDGQRSAVATLWHSPTRGAEIVVYDGAGSEAGRLTIGDNRTTPEAVHSEASVLQFSPDSRRLFVGTGDGRWFLYDARSLTLIWQGADAGRHVVGAAAAFSPDGGRVYVGSGDGNLRAFDAATGGVLWQRWIGGTSYSLAVSASRVVVSGESGFAAYVLDAVTGAILAQYPQEYHVNDVALPSDGSRVYLAGGAGADGECGAFDASLKPLWDLGQPCDNVALDGGGKHVAVAGAGFVVLLNALGDVLWRASLPDPAAGGSAAKGYVWLSPDASKIVVVSPSTRHAYLYTGSVGRAP